MKADKKQPPHAWRPRRSKLVFSEQIAIIGSTGTGTSSLKEGLAKKLECEWSQMEVISIGDHIMMPLSKEYGEFRSKGAFAKYIREHPEFKIDAEIDRLVGELMKKNGKIIDGRVVHLFAPKAFLVKVICPARIRAKRCHADPVRNPKGESLKKVLADILQRDRDDNARYSREYDGYDWKNKRFHVVVNSAKHTKDEMVGIVIKAWKQWLVRNVKYISN